MTDVDRAIASAASVLLAPTQTIPPSEVSRAPAIPGIYGWWFTPGSLPVPSREYVRFDGRELLYVGISPRRPTRDGRHSGGNLRRRLRSHVRHNASTSTLRLTLGLLLAEQLGLQLGAYRGRAHFGPDGEDRLSAWLEEHGQVSWVEHPEPWRVEDEVVEKTVLALNIRGRVGDDFADELEARRRAARANARVEVRL